MPRKSGTKASAKGAITDGSHVLSSAGTAVGTTRGGSTTRGAKRRRTSNNINSNGTELYGSGTIVAANPFDDDHHIAMSNTALTNTKFMKMPPPIHQAPPQIHPLYPSPNYVPHSMPMPPHPQVSTPPGQMLSGPPMLDHVGPTMGQIQPQPVTHNQAHIVPGPHPQHQGFGHHPQAHVIGTSTPPQMMAQAPVLAPSNSPYMHPQQQVPIHIPPTHQAPTTPQPLPHQEMLMQQQPYAISQNIFCGKCQREIYHNEPNIMCKAGCRSPFHVSCSGLTQLAFDQLMRESLAEWVCDRCTQRVPPVKYKS